MDIKIEKISGGKVGFSIKAEGSEIAHFFDMALANLSKDLKLSGFRPGHVPEDVAKSTIGEHALWHEAQDLAINDLYMQMVTKEKLYPIARPDNLEIDGFDKEEGMSFHGEVEVMPEVDVTDWKEKVKKKKISKAESKLDEKEIDDIFSNLKKQFADLEQKDGKTEKGDWVSINMDVVEKEKFSAEQLKKFKADGFAMVIGEAGFIPGFEDELIGLEKEQEKVFDAKFPENYFEKSIAGSKVKFQVKVNEIRKIILPELDDKFAENFGFKKIEELKNAIKEDAVKRKEEEARARYEDEVLKALAGDFSVDCPGSLVEQEKEMIVQRFVHDLEHHKGIKFIDYLNSLGKSEQEFKDGFTEHAKENIKIGIILGEIQKLEKIEVSDSDIEESMSMNIINQTAGMAGDKIKEVEENIRDRYKDEEFLNAMKNSILARKTIDLIINSLGK